MAAFFANCFLLRNIQASILTKNIIQEITFTVVLFSPFNLFSLTSLTGEILILLISAYNKLFSFGSLILEIF